MRTVLRVVILASLLAACAGPVAVSRRAESGARGIPYSLPRTVLVVTTTVGIENEGDAPRPDVSVSVAAQTVADGACQFVLEHRTSDSSDDHLVVDVGSDGLLGAIMAESTQKGAEIARAALKTVVAAAKLAVSQGLMSLQSTSLLDAAIRAQVEDLDAQLLAALRRVSGSRTIHWPLPATGFSTETLHPFPEDPSWELVLSIRPVAEERATGIGAPLAVRGCDLAVANGVVVRGVEPFLVSAELRWEWRWAESRGVEETSDLGRALFARNLDRMEGGEWGYTGTLVSAEGLVELPDYSPVVVVPMDRAMFVHVKHALTFTGGVLTKSDVDRPSPIGAIASFPAEVADTLVALPAQLVQVRIDTIDAAQQLATAESGAQQTAQQARDQSIDDQTQRANAYFDALNAARKAHAAWQAAIGDPDADEGDLATAAAKTMTLANAAAAKAGLRAPFAPGDFPQ